MFRKSGQSLVQRAPCWRVWPDNKVHWRSWGILMATVTKAEEPEMLCPPTSQLPSYTITHSNLVPGSNLPIFCPGFFSWFWKLSFAKIFLHRKATFKVTPCWDFISNGNKRYNNSLFPTNQQMSGCATTMKNWLLSQIQDNVKGIKLAHSKTQSILTEFLFNWQKSLIL